MATVAEGFEVAFDDTDEIVAAVKRGEEPPGDWIDGTQRLREVADRLRGEAAEQHRAGETA